MFWVEVIFWVSLGLVFYTHIGYGLLIWVLTRIKKLFVKNAVPAILPADELPAVTYIVAAYNEEAWISEKIENSLRLQYPSEKLLLWFVTDGSNDNYVMIYAMYIAKSTNIH